jgi:hypothetical protein
MRSAQIIEAYGYFSNRELMVFRFLCLTWAHSEDGGIIGMGRDVSESWYEDVGSWGKSDVENG